MYMLASGVARVSSNPKVGASESADLASAIRTAIKFLGVGFKLSAWWLPGREGPSSVRLSRLTAVVRAQFRRLLCLQHGGGIGTRASSSVPVVGSAFKSQVAEVVCGAPDVEVLVESVVLPALLHDLDLQQACSTSLL